MNAVAGLSRFHCANLHLWGQLQTEAESDLATSSMDEEGKSGIERPSGGNPVMKLDGGTKDVQGQGVKQASWLLIPYSGYNGQTASNSLTYYHRTGHRYLSLLSNGWGTFERFTRANGAQRSSRGTDRLNLGHVYCSGTAEAPLSNPHHFLINAGSMQWLNMDD